ncbi:hypothetical protein MKW98_031755 [Papaver atlanticum]|uniref:BHLH domain-containing protein n=1 Tax=Papaver atlanticum TaxID=357466 RepID=A0AAD4S5P0_9MAGN|nr:hypothetical protein MKW98_031755 [Papaver atlanticum]
MDKRREDEGDIKKLFKNIMEGYSDKVIPFLSDLITDNDDKNTTDGNASADQIVETCFSRKKKSSTKRVKAEVSHQSLVSMETIQKKSKRDLIQPHLSEKERRIKMAEKYSALQSLLLNLKYKRSQTVIIEEVVKYIKNLEEELKVLEESKKKKKKKKESSKTTTNSFRNSIVDVTVSGQAAFFGIQVEINNSAEEPFLFSRVMKVFEYYKTEILTTTITTRNELKMKIIRLSVSVLINEAGGGSIEEIKKGINILFV